MSSEAMIDIDNKCRLIKFINVQSTYQLFFLPILHTLTWYAILTSILEMEGKIQSLCKLTENYAS